jgi:hypothetical protein
MEATRAKQKTAMMIASVIDPYQGAISHIRATLTGMKYLKRGAYVETHGSV